MSRLDNYEVLKRNMLFQAALAMNITRFSRQSCLSGFYKKGSTGFLLVNLSSLITFSRRQPDLQLKIKLCKTPTKIHPVIKIDQPAFFVTDF
ncbi:hypothetical protein [Peribacillus frigoritolerans]|uniref:hypothetical protein n=1 Tax=Peribacillus frigoritolerans TaxID=450367 RepID=UPI00382C669C